jgi:hypothetical protein
MILIVLFNVNIFSVRGETWMAPRKQKIITKAHNHQENANRR